MKDIIFKRFKPTDEETELRLIENLLKEKLGRPFVRCSYDCICSHKYKDTEEFNHRLKTAKETEMPELTDFIINYEIFNSQKEWAANNGGFDDEVHELKYLVDNAGYIVIVDM